jgi:hypothetical protein
MPIQIFGHGFGPRGIWRGDDNGQVAGLVRSQKAGDVVELPLAGRGDGGRLIIELNLSIDFRGSCSSVVTDTVIAFG